MLGELLSYANTVDQFTNQTIAYYLLNSIYATIIQQKPGSNALLLD